MDKAGSMLQSFSHIAVRTATKASEITQRSVNIAGGIMGDAVLNTADAVGLKDKVEAADKAVRNIAARGKNDASRAVNRARRLANRALDFDEEEDAENSAEYDLLLSAAGAIERKIQFRGMHSQTYHVPPNCAMVWKARVKKFDIEFSVREIISTESSPTAIELPIRYSSNTLIRGHLTPLERPRTIEIFFDNTQTAQLQRKSVVHWVAIGEKVTINDDAIGAARQKEVRAADEGPPET